MANTDIVSRITLRLVSNIEEQLARDDVALTTFAAKVDSLKATNLGSIASPSAGGSSGSVAALSAIENGSAKAAAGMNGYSSSVRLASGEEVKLAVVAEATAARLAEAAAKASDAETAAAMRASDRAIAAAQRQQVAVARAFEMDAKAAEAASAKQEAALVRVGKGAGLLSLGILGIGYETSKMAATFQREMEKVHTQAGASQKEVDSLSNSLLLLSGKVATSPELLAQSLYHVESAGFRGAKALDIVRAAAMGAKIGNADLETVTQAMIATQASHIKGVKDDTDAMAQLNAIVGSGDMRMEGLAEAMSTGLLPAAANAGLSLRDVGAAMATVTDNATPPLEAATRLRMTIALLASPSAAAAKALEAVGISASDANAALAHRDELAQYGIHLTDLSADLRKPDGLLVALQDLKKHLEASKLSLTEQDAVISRAFGGGRSSAVIQTLYSQLDRLTSKYKEQAAQATKFQEDWNKTTQTTAFQAAQEKANVDALGIALGQGLVPAVTELLKIVTPLTLEFAKFTSEHKTLVADALLGIGAIAGTVALIAAISKTVGAIKTVALAWDAVKASALAAWAAENMAAIGPVAIVVGAAVLADKYTHKDDASTEARAIREVNKAYEDGKMSTADYAKALASLHLIFPDIQALTKAQIEGTDAGKRHAAAIRELFVATDSVSANSDKLGHRLSDVALQHLAAASGATAHKTALSALDAEIKRLLVDSNQLVDQGLLKEQAAFKTMADSAISEAKRMRAGVEVEAKAMQVAITKSVAWTPLIQPPTTQITPNSALNNHQASFGPVGTQFPTSGPSYNPNGAQTMDPALAASMSGLTSAIHALPPEFQGAFDGELSKYRQQQTDLYNTFLSNTNKENRTHAAAIASIDAAYQATVSQNSKDANAREVAENTRYLNARDGLERGYNDHLQSILNGFLTSYQTLLVNYQAAIAAAQAKAQTDSTNHEDRLSQLQANEQADLAAAKTDADRTRIKEAYAKGLELIDRHYKGIVSANETHVKNLSIGFDNHAKSLKAIFDKQVADSKTSYDTSQKNAAQVHASAIAGIQSWLTGHDSKAQAAREAALVKESGIYLKVVDGIVEAFDKGGKKIAESIAKANTPSAILSTIGSKNDTEYNKAIAAVTLDILEHGKATRADLLALQTATKGRDDLSNAENLATTAAQRFTDALTKGELVLAAWATPPGGRTQTIGGGFQAPGLGQVNIDARGLPGPADAIGSAVGAIFSKGIPVLGDFVAAAAKAKAAYEAGTGSFEEAVRLGKLANTATAATTQKDWDLAFATGDAATKSQMLSAAFSGLISQASTIAGAQAAVDNAKFGVIAAESAVQVQLLQSEVTATQDLGGIITAQAGIQKAISDGQISAINDSTTIMQSSYGVEVAQAAVGQALLTGNSLSIAIANAGLKVAQDDLQIARVTAEMDAANARWSIRIAEDQARLAMDKLITDNANSVAQARVLMDHLQVARDAVDIALAQQKLTIDSMVILANIDSTLGGVADYRKLITGDLDALQSAQAKSTADQYKEAYDQANANQIAAQGGLTLAGDQNSLNTDQASAASVSQAFLLQIAELKKAMAGDTIDQQRLQAIQASLSNIEKSADTIAAATKASEELLDRIRDLNNRGLEGLDRIDVTGSSTATMTNRLGAQMAQNPTHG